MAKIPSLRPRVSYLDAPIANPLPAALGFNDKARGSAHERGYGWAWKKLRLRALERDQYRCQACKRSGRLTAATEVDHVVPKVQGGDGAMPNLQSLCSSCHAEKSKRERQG